MPKKLNPWVWVARDEIDNGRLVIVTQAKPRLSQNGVYDMPGKNLLVICQRRL